MRKTIAIMALVLSSVMLFACAGGGNGGTTSVSATDAASTSLPDATTEMSEPTNEEKYGLKLDENCRFVFYDTDVALIINVEKNGSDYIVHWPSYDCYYTYIDGDRYKYRYKDFEIDKEEGEVSLASFLPIASVLTEGAEKTDEKLQFGDITAVRYANDVSHTDFWVNEANGIVLFSVEQDFDMFEMFADNLRNQIENPPQ